MNLYELIRYCHGNNIKNRIFTIEKYKDIQHQHNIGLNTSLIRKQVEVDNSGKFKITGNITEKDLFPVEFETKITDDTKLDSLIEVYTDTDGVEEYVKKHTNSSINDIIEFINDSRYPAKLIYALIDGKLEIIWRNEAKI